jgi:hypothetical protein
MHLTLRPALFWDVDIQTIDLHWLDKRTLSFCTAIFETPETEFRCFKLAQSNPEHWNY